MGLFSMIAGSIRGMFADENTSNDIERAFGVKLIRSDKMSVAINRWRRISEGKPYWLDPDDDIETVNMAKHISDWRAKLTTLDLGIALSGSSRADFMQPIANKLIERLAVKLPKADRVGGMLFRWNGKTWDFAMQGNFGITEVDGDGDIRGAIIPSYKTQGGESYTRLEYHHFDGDIYVIETKAFRNTQTLAGKSALGKEVPLSTVKSWANLQPEVRISGLTDPLFTYFRVPGDNNIDDSSPLGVSIFANALHELKAVDVSISRKDLEIDDSKHLTFVGQAAIQTLQNRGIKIPRFIMGMGVGVNDGSNNAVHEHNATIQTESRIKDINFNLSMAGVKCGFSEGCFVLDGRTGMITATQVEADDRDTIQTIKDDRDALKTAVERALYGVDVTATLMNLAPVGVYEANYNFGDITYNYEEDKANWLRYTMQGWTPEWLYFTKFEGYSEEEAKALIAEAKAARAEQGLFEQ